MRVAVLTVVHSPIDVRIYQKEALSLAGAGYAVTLYAPWRESEGTPPASGAVGYVRLLRASSRWARPLNWLLLMHRLRKTSADVWHFHDPELLPLAVLWKRLFASSVKLVYDVHEDVPKDILSKRWVPRHLRRPLAALTDKVERWGIRRCQAVIAATDAIARRVVGAGGQALTVHNYPLISSRAHPLSPPSGDRVRIVYAGILIESRGIEEIVEAVSGLDSSRVELLLIGQFHPASFAKRIRAIAGTNIVIKGPVPFEKVATIYQSADVGIVCFHPEPNHVEAMPNKLFEYMEASLPVVASDFPLWRKIIEGTGCGVLVNPLDPRDIAAGLRALIEDPVLRRRMGEAGRRAVREKYSWDKEKEKLLRAYAALNQPA